MNKIEIKGDHYIVASERGSKEVIALDRDHAASLAVVALYGEEATARITNRGAGISYYAISAPSRCPHTGMIYQHAYGYLAVTRA